MFDLILYTSAVALCIFFNRLAGGGWPGHLWGKDSPKRLRGRPLYPAMLGMALVSWALFDWKVALVVGIGFGVWRSPAWGFTISLGRVTGATARGPSAFERFCLGLGMGSIHIALMYRHFICAMPMFFALAVYGVVASILGLPVFAAIAMLCYELGHRLRPVFGDPIRVAELLVGGLWGLLLVTFAMTGYTQ